MYKCGSLFSGIGGFELGLERSIPNLETVWQVEQSKFCQKVLRKHWPNASIYDDVRTVGKHNLEPVDIICGGFPCQDISAAGKQGGIYAERSGLWWEMHRIISELRPRIAVLENVANLITLGMPEVLGSLSEIGYDAEWAVVSAGQFGAPHLRRRLFIVAYSDGHRSGQAQHRRTNQANDISRRAEEIQQRGSQKSPNSDSKSSERVGASVGLQKKPAQAIDLLHRTGSTYWAKTPAPPPVCSVDDGIPDRLAKLRALGNAIVPQCSEWVGRKIWESGLLS